jgi:hypothetical protein
VTSSWTDGPINKANLTAYDGDLAGLNVCWAGIDGTLTMRLWYASSNTTFEEYLYNNEERAWDWQKRWEGFSGAAGVGCVTDPDHPYIYAAFVNLKGSVEIYYRTRREAHVSAKGWEKCSEQNILFRFSGTHQIADKRCLSQRMQPSQTYTSHRPSRWAVAGSSCRNPTAITTTRSRFSI